MLDALVEEMKSSPGPGYVDVWRQTIQGLFEHVIYRLPVSLESLPQEWKRFPKLKGPELDGLLDLFGSVLFGVPAHIPIGRDLLPR